MRTIYTRDVWIPDLGIELGFARKPGGRWTLVGSLDMPGPKRERARKPLPRDAEPITVYARSYAPRLRAKRRRNARPADTRRKRA